MSSRRAPNGVERGQPFEIEVDGRKITAYDGETVAAAMVAEGLRTFRRTSRTAEPRGIYCGIGLCWDCLVVVDGTPNRRACQEPARPGCRVETQDGLGAFRGER